MIRVKGWRRQGEEKRIVPKVNCYKQASTERCQQTDTERARKLS